MRKVGKQYSTGKSTDQAEGKRLAQKQCSMLGDMVPLGSTGAACRHHCSGHCRVPCTCNNNRLVVIQLGLCSTIAVRLEAAVQRETDVLQTVGLGGRCSVKGAACRVRG